MQDDDMPTVLEAMLWAEGIVFATPKHSSHTLAKKAPCGSLRVGGDAMGRRVGGRQEREAPRWTVPGVAAPSTCPVVWVRLRDGPVTVSVRHM